MSGFGEIVRDWGGWAFAGIVAALGLGQVARRTLESRIDSRIIEKVNPSLLSETLAHFGETQERMEAKLEILDTKLDSVITDVARLKGQHDQPPTLLDARARIPIRDP